MSDFAAASPDDAWDAQTYDRRFGFVADLGRDLITLLEPRDGERILDLGCGTGTLTAQLGAAGNVATIIAAVRETAEELGLRADRVASPWYFPTAAEHAAVLERAGLRVRYLGELDRPTPLDDCPDGVADWLRMFGSRLLDGVDPDLREEAITMASARCAPVLYRDGRWFADYRRLRFRAERPPTPAG